MQVTVFFLPFYTQFFHSHTKYLLRRKFSGPHNAMFLGPSSHMTDLTYCNMLSDLMSQAYIV